jgi:hypothetical protein
LGPYEVLAPIGAGGMGEVYRARDSRLGREVALKILPAAFANDADRVRRFEQEGRAAAALNHPNIVVIYDAGSQDGLFYVATELLEGETLRERLAGSALPVRKAVDYAIQTARGLAAAHAKGITHRDLKPENLFLTKDGLVKILDFGLAKQSATRPVGGAHPTELATQPIETNPGVVLGTAGYMSPEQVRGQVADARSDLFSLGVVLYEMVSGKRAFTGDSAVEVMSAILKQEPPDLDAALPPGLDRIIHRCLEKKPEERFESARDLAFALEALSGSAPHQVTAAKAKRRALWPWIGAGVAVLFAGLAGAWAGRMSFGRSVPAFTRLTFENGYVFRARFAPDGHTIVYNAAWNGGPRDVFSMRAGEPGSLLNGLANSLLLSLSSTDEMAVLQDVNNLSEIGRLARVPVAGGAPRVVLDDVTDAAWEPKGDRLAVVHRVNGVTRVEYPVGHVLYETAGYPDSLASLQGAIESPSPITPCWETTVDRLWWWI